MQRKAIRENIQHTLFSEYYQKSAARLMYMISVNKTIITCAKYLLSVTVLKEGGTMVVSRGSYCNIRVSTRQILPDTWVLRNPNKNLDPKTQLS